MNLDVEPYAALTLYLVLSTAQYCQMAKTLKLAARVGKSTRKHVTLSVSINERKDRLVLIVMHERSLHFRPLR